MRTQQILNRLSKCANKRYRKDQTFLWFTINSQSKLKKIQHTILEISTKKNSLRNLARYHGRLFELEILEIFKTAFLLKNYYLNLNFFQALKSDLPKSETKKIFSKKMEVN